jgi:hypothetical protein
MRRKKAVSTKENFVLTLLFLVIIIALLTVAGLFALTAMEKQRAGQSGSFGASSDGGEHGRTAGLD